MQGVLCRRSDDWKKVKDVIVCRSWALENKDSRYYCHNHHTGEVTWDSLGLFQALVF